MPNSSPQSAAEDASAHASNPGPLADHEWQVHGERPVYESPWLTVSLVDVTPPLSQPFEHHAIRMRDVSLVALVKDEHVLLSWRHRFISDVWGWELPGGVVEAGESPAEAGAREILEETGWQPSSLKHLITFEPMVGIATTPHHVFLGLDPIRITDESDAGECARSEWVRLQEIPSLLAAGQVFDAAAVIGLQQLYINHL